jgi:hypothetical protein
VIHAAGGEDVGVGAAVSRFVVTTVPRALFRKYGNGDEPRWLNTKLPETLPLS